ncbi:MAG: hypothetical protein L0Y42_16300 [Phycisphaerales bacterium]|nr:hypothetical protein [Phycisphaerales bacterium]
MRQGTYLNVILTANALLLSGMLWTQMAGQPALEQQALAQTAQEGGQGVPNAAAQRQKMIEMLRDMKVSVDNAAKLLQSGKVRVEVTNIDKMGK